MSDHDITETQKGGKKGASLPGKAAIQTHGHATIIRGEGHAFSYRIYLQLKKGCYDLIAKMALWVPSTSQAREKNRGHPGPLVSVVCSVSNGMYSSLM